MPSRALVTGGGRGIGAGIARELAAAGWHVTVTGRTAEQVEAVAREIDGAAVVGDVAEREDVERMVAAAEPIDLLVANAGIAAWEDSWETDPDDWWHVLEVNVRGVYLTLPARVAGDDRTRRRPSRDHGQRLRVPPRLDLTAPTARARPRSAASARCSQPRSSRTASRCSSSARASSGPR